MLKVIEDGRFRRVGAIQERQVNLRIIAATNQDLEERIRLGLFRADLYFRLRVLHLDVPPLRERKGDAVLLARYFLDHFGQRYRREGVRLNAEAEAVIAGHRWPGNVRELRNVIEQAVLLSAGQEIGAQDLMLPGAARASVSIVSTLVSGNSESGDSVLDRMERDALEQALGNASGNVSKAARELGISRDTLRYRMEKPRLR